ncbi:MAG: TonB-dependent receptor plug domain-containing protein [Prevotellaceae bacterium]|nr:TonB-dependent receptor plug domain-containing protein [Prevotellaceae bacterium]
MGGGKSAVIRGTVKNEKGEPVEYAAIYIKNTQSGTQSDAEGKFFLHVLPGTQTLCVQLLGHALYEKQVEPKPHERIDLKIQLEDGRHNLGEVVVEAKSPVQRVKESAYNVVAIDAKALQNTTLDLAHAMEKVSGVKIRESGGLGSNVQFSLNGFTGRHVKFFMDGVPMEGFGASFQINNIPVNLAERIEIYKGVVPIGFGSDAIGGAVNIVTNQKQRTFVDASYSYGSFNTHRTSVSAGHTAKNGLMFELTAYQNYSDNTFHIDNAVKDLDNGQIDVNKIERIKRFHDTYHNETVILKAGLVNKKFADRLIFSVNLGQSYKELQNGVRQDVVYGQKHSRSRTLMPSVQYAKRNLFTKGLDLTLTANLNKNTSRNVDTARYEYSWRGESRYNGGKLGEQNYQDSEYANQNWNTTANAVYRISARQSLMLNNVLTSFDRNTRATASDASLAATDTMPKVSQKNVAGVSYKYSYDNKWNVSVFGKRYLQRSKGPKATDDGRGYLLADESFTATGYGIAGTVFLLEDIQVKLSYEKAYRLPTDSELFGDEDLEHGSAGLTAENSDNYNLNLSLSKAISRKHFIYADAGFILRNTKDYIRRVTEAVSNKYFATHINHGYVRNTGVNGELRYSYANLVSTGVNVTYQNIRDNEKLTMSSAASTTYKVRIPNIPYFFANGDVELSLQNFLWEKNHLNIGYTASYVREFSLYFENHGRANTKKAVPSQLSHDLSATYLIADGRYNVALECRNLTDAKLYDNFSLQKPGRAFYIKIRYFFIRSK